MHIKTYEETVQLYQKCIPNPIHTRTLEKVLHYYKRSNLSHRTPANSFLNCLVTPTHIILNDLKSVLVLHNPKPNKQPEVIVLRELIYYLAGASKENINTLITNPESPFIASNLAMMVLKDNFQIDAEVITFKKEKITLTDGSIYTGYIYNNKYLVNSDHHSIITENLGRNLKMVLCEKDIDSIACVYGRNFRPYLFLHLSSINPKNKSFVLIPASSI